MHFNITRQLLSLYSSLYFYRHPICQLFLPSKDLLAYSVYAYVMAKIILHSPPLPYLVCHQISPMMQQSTSHFALPTSQSLVLQIHDLYSPNFPQVAIHYDRSVLQSWIDE